ncbi:MAG TPA: DegT/DnrJ/EryC1/StrS family aminotransferase [Lacunisphaera sp.]|nr:DegT/DnrJ/EryC1/StrS family aminotransferase [Lacunisphaera sp.]
MDENVIGQRFTYYRGRVAMAELLKAAGVRKGDEVAIQAFTCVAVPEAVLSIGACPVYIDIERDGYNMASASLAGRLTDRIKAVVVQHTFGLPADLTALGSVAGQAGIPVIEDCCHTYHSRVGGALVGQNCFGAFSSVEWGKPIAAGIGGVAWSGHAEVREKLAVSLTHFTPPATARGLKLWLQLLAHRVLYRPSWYWPVRRAFKLLARLGAAEGNYNAMAEVAVAPDFHWKMVGHVERRVTRMMRELADITAHADAVAERYRTGIRGLRAVHPSPLPGTRAVYVRYPLRVANKPALLAAARKANVELGDWYSTPIHPLGPRDWATVAYQAGSCPEAEKRCGEVVTLPTHRATRMRDVDRAITLFNQDPIH